MQTLIVITAIALSVAYAARHVWKTFHRKSPACEGCALKERCTAEKCNKP